MVIDCRIRLMNSELHCESLLICNGANLIVSVEREHKNVENMIFLIG